MLQLHFTEFKRCCRDDWYGMSLIKRGQQRLNDVGMFISTVHTIFVYRFICRPNFVNYSVKTASVAVNVLTENEWIGRESL